MSDLNSTQQKFERAEDGFEERFSFRIPTGLTKVVTIVRRGQACRVTTRYIGDEGQEDLNDSFEVDGAVTMISTDEGVYVMSKRNVLAGRIVTRRTRYF